MVPPAVGGGYEHRPSPYYGGAPPPPYGPPPPVGMSGSYGPAPYQHLGMRYGYGPGPYGSSGSYPPYSSYHSPGPMGGTLSISSVIESVNGTVLLLRYKKGRKMGIAELSLFVSSKRGCRRHLFISSIVDNVFQVL